MKVLRKLKRAEVWLTTRSKRTRILAGVMAVVFLGVYGVVLWNWGQCQVTIEASGYVIDAPDVEGQDYLDNTIILED